MDWKSTWKQTVREKSNLTPLDTIDKLTKFPVLDEAVLNSVNIVNCANQHSKQTVFDEFCEENELFLYLRHDITSGGPYRKLWPKVRNYIRRELPKEMFLELDRAHKECVACLR